MTHNLNAGIRVRRPRKYVTLGVAVVALAQPVASEAASILNQVTDKIQDQAHKLLHGNNGSHLTAQEAQDLKQFLKGGPAVWSRTPPPRFPSPLVITNPDGSLR